MEKKFIQFLRDNRILTRFKKNSRSSEIKKHCKNIESHSYLSSSFKFDRTPEGHTFWWELHTKWLEFINKKGE